VVVRLLHQVALDARVACTPTHLAQCPSNRGPGPGKSLLDVLCS
jgi:hypothetical protein